MNSTATRVSIGALLLLVALVSCNSAEGPTSAAPRPRSAYLPQAEDPPLGLAGYGVLLFTSEPSAEQRGRYELVAQAFRRHLPTMSAEEAMGPRVHEIAVTFWLMTSSDAVDSPSTSDMVDRYDYRRAIDFAAQLGKGGARGPILVTSPHRFADYIGRSPTLVLDMSILEKERDFNCAFEFWRGRIVMDPASWNSWSTRLAKMRLVLYGLLGKSSEPIIEVLDRLQELESSLPESPSPAD